MTKLLTVLIITMVLVACFDPMLSPMRSVWGGGDTTTVTVHVAWPWDSEAIYSKGDVATMPEFTKGGPIYESLRDGNTGIMPPSMIGTNGSAFGPAGGQLPWVVPTKGWEAWWKLMETRE